MKALNAILTTNMMKKKIAELENLVNCLVFNY